MACSAVTLESAVGKRPKTERLAGATEHPCLRRTADIDGRRRRRSPDTNMLVIASTRRSTLGDRSFPVAASRAWNACVGQSCDVTCVFSQGAEDGSFPEQL